MAGSERDVRGRGRADLEPAGDVRRRARIAGDPDLASASSGPGPLCADTASVVYHPPGGTVTPGVWYRRAHRVRPVLGPAPAGTAPTRCSSRRKGFDTTVTSTTGDLWLPSVNPATTFSPVNHQTGSDGRDERHDHPDRPRRVRWFTASLYVDELTDAVPPYDSDGRQARWRRSRTNTRFSGGTASQIDGRRSGQQTDAHTRSGGERDDRGDRWPNRRFPLSLSVRRRSDWTPGISHGRSSCVRIRDLAIVVAISRGDLGMESCRTPHASKSSQRSVRAFSRSGSTRLRAGHPADDLQSALDRFAIPASARGFCPAPARRRPPGPPRRPARVRIPRAQHRHGARLTTACSRPRPSGFRAGHGKPAPARARGRLHATRQAVRTGEPTAAAETPLGSAASALRSAGVSGICSPSRATCSPRRRGRQTRKYSAAK